MNIKNLSAGLLTGVLIATNAAAHPGDGPAGALTGLFDPLHGHTHVGESVMAAILLIGCGLVLYTAIRRRQSRRGRGFVTRKQS